MKTLLFLILLTVIGCSKPKDNFTYTGTILQTYGITDGTTGKIVRYVADVSVDNVLVTTVFISIPLPRGTEVEVICKSEHRIICFAYEVGSLE